MAAEKGFTPEDIAALRREGLSIAEIQERTGLTKGQIIEMGRQTATHRSRPSSERREGPYTQLDAILNNKDTATYFDQFTSLTGLDRETIYERLKEALESPIAREALRGKAATPYSMMKLMSRMVSPQANLALGQEIIEVTQDPRLVRMLWTIALAQHTTVEMVLFTLMMHKISVFEKGVDEAFRGSPLPEEYIRYWRVAKEHFGDRKPRMKEVLIFLDSDHLVCFE